MISHPGIGFSEDVEAAIESHGAPCTDSLLPYNMPAMSQISRGKFLQRANHPDLNVRCQLPTRQWKIERPVLQIPPRASTILDNPPNARSLVNFLSVVARAVYNSLRSASLAL